jgi:hypothetical protein
VTLPFTVRVQRQQGRDSPFQGALGQKVLLDAAERRRGRRRLLEPKRALRIGRTDAGTDERKNSQYPHAVPPLTSSVGFEL